MNSARRSAPRSLVVICAARPILDRLLPEPRSASPTTWADRDEACVRLRRPCRHHPGPRSRGAPGGMVVRRRSRHRRRRTPRGACRTGCRGRTGHAPAPGRAGDVPPDHASIRTSTDWTTRSSDRRPGTVLTLAENLELENQALLRADPTILFAVDHGDRLIGLRHASTRPCPRAGRSSRGTVRRDGHVPA